MTGHDAPQRARHLPRAPRGGRLTLPLTDDRLWTLAEVAWYAGNRSVDQIRRLPIPWATGNPDPEGRGERLYDPKEVKAYFAARRRQGAA